MVWARALIHQWFCLLFCYHCRCVCPRVVRISANKNRSQNRMREKKMRMLLLPSKSLLNALCIMWWRRLKSLRMLFLNVTMCACVCEWVRFFLLILASFATQPFHLTGHNYMYILCNTLSFCSASFEHLNSWAHRAATYTLVLASHHNNFADLAHEHTQSLSLTLSLYSFLCSMIQRTSKLKFVYQFIPLPFMNIFSLVCFCSSLS